MNDNKKMFLLAVASAAIGATILIVGKKILEK